MMVTKSEPRILIVDDEPLVRRTLAEIIRNGGFSATAVSRGKEAIGEIQRQFYHLVLLDLNLPDMSGLDVVKHIKHHSPKTEIVIITGYASLKTAIEALERGVMAYVEKPVRPNQLIATINSVLEKQRLKFENERMLRQLSALLYFAQDITSELELDELLRRIVIRATELTNAEKGFIALREGDVLQLRQYWDGRCWVDLEMAWKRGEGIPGQVWVTEHPYMYTKSDPDPLVTPSVLSAFQLEACLCSPITDTMGRFIGVLQVINKVGDEPFTLDDLSMLQALSRQAAIAIENARLYERQKEEAEISTSLLRVAESISQFTNLDELLGMASKIVPGLLGCDQFGLFLLDRAKNIFYGAKARGSSAEQEAAFCALKFRRGKAGILDEVTERREAMVLEDVAREQAIDPSYVRQLNLRSCLLVPLIAKGDVVGVMGVGYSMGPHRFTARDIKIATGVAHQLAVAIENANLFAEVSSHKAALQRLSMRLANVLEEERARISRELHDGVGQVLSGMLIGMDVLEEKVPPSLGEIKEGLKQMKMLTEKTLDELRRLSHDLRPSLLDDLGLLDALQWLGDYLAERCGWTVNLIVDEDFPRLPTEIETALFRISQEALNNIRAHANASTVTLRLHRQDDIIQLEISDDGRGFDPAALDGAHRGLGLLSMRERATALGGEAFIESEVGKGTTIKIIVPWPNSPRPPAPVSVEETPYVAEKQGS